jgi:lipoprotein-releasing system ATP-binding protein
MSDKPILKLIDVSHTYLRDSETPVHVLRGINMEIEGGATIAITGPSGSGKSTLLNLMGALDRPTTGRILFGETGLHEMDAAGSAEFRNKHIGFVFQDHHLLPQLTVLENILLPAIPAGTGRSSGIRKRADELLEKVGLSHRRNHLPAQLSGGECQRTAVARALINSPQIILADEPTGSLDSDNADRIVDLLLELNGDQSTTLIMVTHAEKPAGRMQVTYRIRNGQIEN